MLNKFRFEFYRKSFLITLWDKKFSNRKQAITVTEPYVVLKQNETFSNLNYKKQHLI
jgi:hypothetical protein